MVDEKRILVDMSVTLLHNGHTRILAAASKLGRVIVALTTDEEVLKWKGYKSELDFETRKEILEALRNVDEVLPSPWLIDDEYLDAHSIDFLVHGGNNSNTVRDERLVLLPRTKGISSSLLRQRVLENAEK